MEEIRRRLLAALLAVPLPTGGNGGGGGDPAPLAPADLFGRVYVGEAALAPDGRHALVVETVGSGGPAQLVALEWGLRGASRTVHPLPADSFGRIRFDGASGEALFLRGAPPAAEVWRIAPGGEPERALPQGAAANVFELYPRPATGEVPWLALANTTNGPREAILCELDLERGEVGRVVARFGPLTIRQSALAPDGRTLALTGTEQPTFAAEGEPLDLWICDLPSGATRRLTDGGLQLDNPLFTPDGTAVVCALRPATTALTTAKREIATIDVATGARRVLTTELPLSIGNGIFGADEPMTFIDGRTLLVATQHGMADDILAITLPKGDAPATCTWQSDGTRAWSRLAAAPAAQRVLAVESGPARPERVTLREWPDGAPRVIEDANGELAARGLAPWRRLAFRGAGGLPLEGLLLEPVGAQPPFPTIVALHGGSDGRSTLRFNDNFAQTWAAYGFAVFLPNLRGSEGYSVAFTALNRGDAGGAELDDLEAAAELLVARGVADPERLFVTGHSYGGYLAEMAAMRSQKFRAVCAAAGVSDWTSFFASSDLAGLAVVALGGTPEQRPELYMARSPRELADATMAPLLLIHGQRDRRVPAEQSERLFAALSRRGLPCEIVTLPGVGHAIRGRDNVMKWLDAAADFFRRAPSRPPVAAPAAAGAPVDDGGRR